MATQPQTTAAERSAMAEAIAAASAVRSTTSPNPWVGAAIIGPDGSLLSTGATNPPGGDHAEVCALRDAGDAVVGATLLTTLEPCNHHGRTPPCTEAIIKAGIRKVVIALLDPDERVSGQGVARLVDAGLAVVVGVHEAEVAEQLAPYLHHRRTGRPYVVAKMAATLDGGTAAPDGTSEWITGIEARHDVHRLRAASDAILVGRGTVLADDPALTVRHVDGRNPRRIVLGTVPPDAAVRPCVEWTGTLVALLEQLGSEGVLQLLVEGGATVIRSFHDAGLIDRYVFYLAPALFGGSDAHPILAGPTTQTMEDLWRGSIRSAAMVGSDLRIDMTKGS